MKEVLAALAAMLSLAACAGSAPTPVVVYVTPEPTTAPTATPAPITHSITGTFDLLGTFGGTSCYGSGGYDDIREGVGVTLRDGNGIVIATSALDRGVSRIGSCHFTFSIPDAPDAPFYSVEVSHRGEMTKSAADLAAAGWAFALELGP